MIDQMRKSTKRLASAVAGSLILASAAGAAHAVAVLDQSNLPTNLRYTDTDEWQQEVTAGVSGELDGIELYGGDVSNLVRIAVGDAFQTGPFDFSQTVHLTATGLYIDTSAAHITLSAGDTFVIDVSGGTTCCFLKGSTATYAGGDLYDKGGNFPPLDWTTSIGGSLAFQTFMAPAVTDAVPEPGAWLLMTAGFGLTGAAVRRRRAAALPG